MNTKLQVALVGCGLFGDIFCPFVREFADVVALCDTEEQACGRVAQRVGLADDAVRCFTDYRAMLDSERLDAVVITAPNFAHADIAVAAAQAGVHVFCEKAMARTVPECWRMVRAAHENNVRLMVGHKRRLRTPWQRMRQLTAPDLLGEALSITVTQYCGYRREFGDPKRWWSTINGSGGYLHLHGVHIVDWLRSLMGNIKTVWAVAGPRHDPVWEFQDIQHTTFQFESGAVASLCGSLAFPMHRFRECEIPIAQCRHGGFKMSPHLDHIDLHWQRTGTSRSTHERFDDLGHEAAYRKELGDFARWITEGRRPCLTWIEGLRCVEAMEASYRSAAAGGAPIKLPLYPELEDPSLLRDVSEQPPLRKTTSEAQAPPVVLEKLLPSRAGKPKSVPMQ